jgi:hypothetical protein
MKTTVSGQAGFALLKDELTDDSVYEKRETSYLLPAQITATKVHQRQTADISARPKGDRFVTAGGKSCASALSFAQHAYT